MFEKSGKTDIEPKLNYDRVVNQGGLSASCDQVIRNLDRFQHIVFGYVGKLYYYRS